MASITYTAGEPTSGGGESVLPPGQYNFRVVGADLTESKAGNSMIELKCRHLKDDGSTGRAVFSRLVFTTKALWRVDQFLASCGKHPGSGEDFELDTDDMIGWEFRAEVEIVKDNKDRDQNEFTQFIATDDESPF